MTNVPDTGVTIDALDAAGTLSGGEVVPVVQNGVTVKAQVSDFVLSASILAALGVNPAVIPNGSAAAPGLALVNSSTTGLYRPQADSLGITAKGLQAVTVRHQDVLGTDDGMIMTLGRAQTHSGAEAYPTTLFCPTQTMSSTSAAVIFSNLFPSSLVAAASGTYASKSFNIELDKLEVTQTGGAVTFSGGVGGVRVRIPIAKTSVTFGSAIGISFTNPNSADVTGTHTTTKFIHFPTSTGGPASTYYGLFFDEAYNGGAIGSGTNVPIYINSGGASGYVSLGQNGGEALRVSLSGGNRVLVQANSTPMLSADGSGSNINLILSSKGTQSVDLMTGTGSRTILRAFDATSAVNYGSVTGAATGAAVAFGVGGTDTDIDLQLTPKGSGNVRFGTHSALGAETVSGFITIKDAAGNSRKVAIVS